MSAFQWNFRPVFVGDVDVPAMVLAGDRGSWMHGSSGRR